MPPAFQAVLFDFDGTLADSYAAITASVNHVAGVCGKPAWAEDEVRVRVGFGLHELMEQLFPDVDSDEAVGHYREHHPSVLKEGTRLLPGVREALQALRRADVPMAVCSNKAVAFTRELVGVLGVGEFFTAVLGPEDVPKPKPAPDMLLRAVERLGVDRGAALYVGDMTVDIHSAQAAGVTVWAVPTGSHTAEQLAAASPDRLISSVNELPTLLGLTAE